MYTSNLIYKHAGEMFHGFVAYDESNAAPRPAVLIAHDWTGRNSFVCEKAKMLARLGYVGFALDMYGQGRMGDTVDEKVALMTPLKNNRKLLLERSQVALATLMALPQVDNQRVAAIGFCFGGLCVLDLARSGAALKGVVSFHGVLDKSDDVPNEVKDTKILVLHGFDDPMVKPEAVYAFCEEMTAVKADWQVHCYGNTQHAFTNPSAHDKKLGTVFNAQAEQRSFQAMGNFLDDILA